MALGSIHMAEMLARYSRPRRSGGVKRDVFVDAFVCFRPDGWDWLKSISADVGESKGSVVHAKGNSHLDGQGKKQPFLKKKKKKNPSTSWKSSNKEKGKRRSVA